MLHSGVPRLKRVIPLLLVENLPPAIQYYHEALGFEILFTYDERYAEIQRDTLSIHLSVMTEYVPPDPRRVNATLQDLWIEVSNVEALYEELQARNARIIAPLNLKLWSSLEFTVEDLDGNRICFGEFQG